MGFPGGISGKEPAFQCRRQKRCRFSPWVGTIPLEEEMATHPSILAWRIPWTEEPGRLQFMGSRTVGILLNTHTHTQLSIYIFKCNQQKPEYMPLLLSKNRCSVSLTED